MATILANGDAVGWAGVAVGVLSMILGSFTAVMLARVQRAQQLQDGERTMYAAKVGKLEADLAGAGAEHHVLIEKLIDERFRAISHEVKNHGQALVNSVDDAKRSIDEIKRRLEDGDDQFDGLVNSDHKIELKVVEKMDGLKDDIRDMFIQHEQVDARSFQALGGKVADLAAEVKVLAAIKRDAPGITKRA